MHLGMQRFLLFPLSHRFAQICPQDGAAIDTSVSAKKLNARTTATSFNIVPSLFYARLVSVLTP